MYLQYIIAGGFAIGAGIHRSCCMVVTNLTLSIVASLFAFIQIAGTGVLVGLDISVTCKEDPTDPEAYHKYMVSEARDRIFNRAWYTPLHTVP